MDRSCELDWTSCGCVAKVWDEELIMLLHGFSPVVAGSVQRVVVL